MIEFKDLLSRRENELVESENGFNMFLKAAIDVQAKDMVNCEDVTVSCEIFNFEKMALGNVSSINLGDIKKFLNPEMKPKFQVILVLSVENDYSDNSVICFEIPVNLLEVDNSFKDWLSNTINNKFTSGDYMDNLGNDWKPSVKKSCCGYCCCKNNK